MAVRWLHGVTLSTENSTKASVVYTHDCTPDAGRYESCQEPDPGALAGPDGMMGIRKAVEAKPLCLEIAMDQGLSLVLTKSLCSLQNLSFPYTSLQLSHLLKECLFTSASGNRFCSM